MDTARDARVLVLEDALRRLNHIVKQRRMKLHTSFNELAKTLDSIEKVFYEVKYSYLDPHALADLEATKKIINAGKGFRELYEQAIKASRYDSVSIKEKIVHAEVKYSLRIIEGFVNRLRNFNEDPGYAIDILAVQITQLKPVEGSAKLIECRCTDGTRIWNVATNLQGITNGVKLSCAILPPTEIMGVVSEAMFLGGEQLPDSIHLGIISTPSSSALAQARAQVLSIIKRLK